MTATWSGSFRSPKACRARLATSMTSTSARPQLGQAIRSTFLRSRSPSASSSWRPALRLLDRIGGERVADGVADALHEQRGDARGGLDQPRGRRSGLGDTEVQRVVGGLRELAVGLDHQRDAGGLDRDLDEVEVDLLEVGQLEQRRLDHRLGRDATVLLVQAVVERAAVDADPDRDAAVAGLGRHRLDVLGPADVAGVEAEAVHAGLERGQGHPVLVVDVGDDRHRRAGDDLRQPLGRLGLVAGATDDVAARRGQRVDLLQRALDVGRLGDRHRLHRDRRAAADGDLAHHDLPGRPAADGHAASAR